MLEGFALLKSVRPFSIGFTNLKQIYASFKKPIVLQKWKMYGKNNGRVTCFFSHGSSHSRGVLILVRDHLDFKLQSFKADVEGRFILLEAIIQETPFLFINIYAPNKCAEQREFFKTIAEEIKSCVLADYSIVVGGDFNVIFDQDIDGSGGVKKKKDSVKYLEDICLDQDLVDIWRIRNPTDMRFT